MLLCDCQRRTRRCRWHRCRYFRSRSGSRSTCRCEGRCGGGLWSRLEVRCCCWRWSCCLWRWHTLRHLGLDLAAVTDLSGQRVHSLYELLVGVDCAFEEGMPERLTEDQSQPTSAATQVSNQPDAGGQSCESLATRSGVTLSLGFVALLHHKWHLELMYTDTHETVSAAASSTTQAEGTGVIHYHINVFLHAAAAHRATPAVSRTAGSSRACVW